MGKWYLWRQNGYQLLLIQLRTSGARAPTRNFFETAPATSSTRLIHATAQRVQPLQPWEIAAQPGGHGFSNHDSAGGRARRNLKTSAISLIILVFSALYA